MRRRGTIVLRLAAFLLLARSSAIAAAVAAPPIRSGAAAGPSDARAVLERVTRTYRGLTSFAFDATVNVEMLRAGQRSSFDFHYVAAGAKPNRFRVEMDNPMMGATMVSDGKSVVLFSNQLQQYTRKPAPRAVAGPDTVGRLAGPNSPIAQYYHLLRGLTDARWVRAEPVTLGGRAVECDVIAADYQHPPGLNATYSPTFLWVERERALVLRESTFVHVEAADTTGPSEMSQSTSYVTARTNQVLPESLFAFRPPAGAKEVQSFPGEQTVDLSGQKAFDFTLADLSDKPVKLSSLRGKVVILDFWATWCGPCRIEMPSVQKLHEEFGSKGLVVLGVDYGEEPGRVRTFLAKNPYTFRILMDRDQSVGTRYQVNGIPSLFVIDRTGTISSHFIGVRDEDTLREALAKAGIK